MIEKIRECFDKIKIPIAPRNSSIVYDKDQSENSEKFGQFHDDLELQNKGNSQDSRDSPFHFSEPINLYSEEKGATTSLRLGILIGRIKRTYK